MSIQKWVGKTIKGNQFTEFNYDQDKAEGYPYAMICFVIDTDTTIAVGVDPASPAIFRLQNMETNFILDMSVAPRKMHTMQGYKTVYYAKQVMVESDDLEEDEWELNFVFRSSDHLRYENGRHISGPHGGAPRAVKVESNINGNTGYSVTMFNTDGPQPVVQMAPKQMKVVGSDYKKIILRGYGRDASGASFADYGLTIFHNEGNIDKCILHLHDRDIDIEYLP